MKTIHVSGMWGLGDNVYQRPFIKALSDKGYNVRLETPWPELYMDILNVEFVKTVRALRTQMKNVNRQDTSIWAKTPKLISTPVIRNMYTLQKGSIYDNMLDNFKKYIGDAQLHLDLPRLNSRHNWSEITKSDKPIALVRPVTVRKEWMNINRNPLPEYIEQMVNILKDKFYIVLVADIDKKNEWLVGNLPYYDTMFINGELNINQLVSLVQASAVLAGPVGWILPAAIAAQKPALIVHGGQGGHNHPQKLIAPHWRHAVTSILPDKFCMCTSMRGTHTCDKRITNLEQLVTTWLNNYTSTVS